MVAVGALFALAIYSSTSAAPALDSNGGQWIRENPNQDKFLGISWDAAAGVVNKGRVGRFLVPKQVLEAKTRKGSDIQSDMVVLFQESWCSTMDGNTLADICESMCPLYYGGAEVKYRVNNIVNLHGANIVNAVKLEDVKASIFD
ncbi:unnamed protein product [Cylicocyclus nassatus]|uniref:Uncharacterized protein n=1 Tax=Cylicocyclus nassatus TaxID=53992 RepID=A0AA36DJZ9_CYLNA|nr:unnamed protein product [Cylicocyclus nassatus]